MEIFSIVIALAALLVAFFSWQANTKPLLIFFMKETERYAIKNVGNGPALNIVVCYAKENNSHKWINPVKCYSLEAGSELDLNWLLQDDYETLIKKSSGREKLPCKNAKPVGAGVAKYGVAYSSAFGLNLRYFSVCEHDVTNTTFSYFNWREDEISRIWELEKVPIKCL